MIPWLVCGGLLLLLVIGASWWAWRFWRKINREAAEFHEQHALTTWQRRRLASDVGWQRMIGETEQEAERHTQEYDDGPLAS